MMKKITSITVLFAILLTTVCAGLFIVSAENSSSIFTVYQRATEADAWETVTPASDTIDGAVNSITKAYGKVVVNADYTVSAAIDKTVNSSLNMPAMLAAGKTELYEQMVAISSLANITYVRQKETKGLGHAILCAKSFVGNEPFAVLYGDDVILGENPVCRQLCDAYDQYGLGVVGIKEVTPEQIKKYSSMKVEPLSGRQFRITDMVEKPATPEQTFSLYSILGRCVLPPQIFDILESIPYGVGGELQLTDAMKVLAQRETMIGVDFEGRRYDMGSKLGILQAIVEVGLSHPEIGAAFREYLKGITEAL